MSKNIVLIDLFLTLFPKIMSDDNVNVCLLVVLNNRLKQSVLDCHPKLNIMSCQDIRTYDCSFVSQSDILKYSDIQVKFERQMNRFNFIQAEIINFYLNSLSFWMDLFKKNTIQYLFLSGAVDHGVEFDTIPIRVALSYSIPTYHIDPVCEKPGVYMYAIRCCNSERYLNLNELSQLNSSFIVKKLDVFSQLFDKKTQSMRCIPGHTLSHQSILFRIVFRYINTIYLITLRLFGNGKYADDLVGSLDCVRFIKNVLNKIWLFDYVYYLGTHHEPDDCVSPITFNTYYHFKSEIAKLKKYYSRHAVSSIPSEECVILYAMHFEPEAQIMNRTTYNCQIYNIRMLARSLPPGWKVYVKEHPATFGVSLHSGCQYIQTFGSYKNTRYYDELLSIPNVLLLSLDYSMGELLSSNLSQIKAVATINGTVALECMFAKKPVIIFDQGSVPYDDISDILNVTCFDDLQQIMGTLFTGHYVPEYSNVSEILGNYLLARCPDGTIDVPSNILSVLMLHGDTYVRVKSAI